jgi:hypothetical protein
MKIGIIFAHGTMVLREGLSLPQGVSVVFYQGAHQEMLCSKADAIYAYLSRNEIPPEVIYPRHTVWTGSGFFYPNMRLTADPLARFKAGYMIVGTSVGVNLTGNAVWDLYSVCRDLREAYRDDDIEIHYLACLTT